MAHMQPFAVIAYPCEELFPPRFWNRYNAGGYSVRLSGGAIVPDWGVMQRDLVTGRLTYWIGMFTPAGTPVPEGVACVDFPAMGLGTCWICGPEDGVHDTGACRSLLDGQGMRVWRDAEGSEWSFENCLYPRYTTPDEKGNVILDYCCYVE